MRSRVHSPLELASGCAVPANLVMHMLVISALLMHVLQAVLSTVAWLSVCLFSCVFRPHYQFPRALFTLLNALPIFLSPLPGPPPDPSTLEACKPKEYRDINRVVNSVNPGVIKEEERYFKRQR